MKIICVLFFVYFYSKFSLHEVCVLTLLVCTCKEIYLSGQGIDSIDCGNFTDPCRSISHAIQIASSSNNITTFAFLSGVYKNETLNIGESYSFVAIEPDVYIVGVSFTIENNTSVQFAGIQFYCGIDAFQIIASVIQSSAKFNL